jgi:hypothetical protein
MVVVCSERWVSQWVSRLATDYRPKTPGDLEAVILAESFDLLSSIVGPYMYSVVGDSGRQQAAFRSEEVQALFYIRVHEFLADAQKMSPSASLPPNLSLLSGGTWIAKRHRARAEHTGLLPAYEEAERWFAAVHPVVFWAPSVWRHLRLELSMATLISMRANLEKHQLLRLNREIRRLQAKCEQAECDLTMSQAVAVRPEFEAHLKGMLQYHATEVAEHIARCLLGLHRYVKELYRESPTNNLDVAKYPSDVSDDVFRYMYTSTVFHLAQWTEQRITSSIPETAPSFQHPYPQHADWSIVERERSDP